MIPQIDLRRQHAALREELLAAAERVLTTSQFILGPEGRAFEDELARFCGATHGVGVNSGTDALLLALRTVGVGPGDEVITSAFSFVASGTTIQLAGATPVFVDVDPVTMNLDPTLVEKAITPRTRAIVPVHLFGQVAQMDAITAIASARGLSVVADAAQAIGGDYDGCGVGAWGDLVCLSFYPTKNLAACGDAGMVLTTREDLAARLRRLRDHGAAGKYQHMELGISSRLDEMQAAFLRVKLPRLAGWNEARRRLAARYTALFRGLPLVLPVERPPARHVYHQFTIRCAARDALAAALRDVGVGTAVHYPAIIPAQPLYARPGAEDEYPQAAAAAREVLSLPCFPEITDAEIEQVADAVRASLTRIGIA